jgi:hypothetical protein
MTELTTTAKDVVAKRRSDIDKVAEALMKNRKLTGQEVRELMSDGA